MDAKRALEEANDDFEKAKDILKEKGIADAEKRASRATGQGVIESYIHQGNRLGAIIEINCETDFVARTSVTPTVSMPLSLAASAMTGAAPVPVPPPIPAVTNNICVPSN